MISTIAFLPNPIWLVQLRIFCQFVETSRMSRMWKTPNYSLEPEPHPQACWPVRHCEGSSLKEKTLCNSIDLWLCIITCERDGCCFGVRVCPLLSTELGAASWVSCDTPWRVRRAPWSWGRGAPLFPFPVLSGFLHFPDLSIFARPPQKL